MLTTRTTDSSNLSHSMRGYAKGKSTTKKRPAYDDPNALLTTTEAAEILNVHLNTVRRWSNNGILTAYRIGPRCDRRIRRQDIDNLLMKQSAASKRIINK